MINWKIKDSDYKLIEVIATRAEREADKLYADIGTVLMDLTACHVNGCALNLKALSKADTFNLLHDVFGIGRHINRNNGKIDGCFVPRFAK